MSFVNNYRPPSPVRYTEDLTKPYDVNFMCPVPTLESSVVKLTPFIPHIHGEQYALGAAEDPTIYQHISLDLIHTFNDTAEIIRSDPTCVLFAIIAKSGIQEGKGETSGVAGVIGIWQASERNRSCEIGPVIILPKFRGTLVTKHSIGLVLQYILDLPTDSVSRMGFRRVHWLSSSDNIASIRVAERSGFRQEGVLRWSHVMQGEGKVGQLINGVLARHSVLLAICWDDWENGAKEKVRQLLEVS